MNKPKKSRRFRLFANKIHRNIFLLVFVAAFLPAFICCTALFYLIFNITANQLGIPEAIAYTLIPAAEKVIYIISSTAPVCIIAILILAHKISHKIIGPFDRIEKELFECVKGNRRETLKVREGDKFWPMVNKINMLLLQLWEKENS